MSTRSQEPTPRAQELERLLELARRADPGEGSPTDARRLARRAVLASHERRRARRVRRNLLLLAASCGALVLLLLSPVQDAARNQLAALFVPSSAPASHTAGMPSSAPWKPLEIAMPKGDRLFATPGAQFELLESTPGARRIALREGTAVFSVEPLAHGELFSVQTPHLRVVVRGTVFSVEVDAQRTRVRVHEGAVLTESAESDGPTHSLRAGEHYASDATAVPELLSEPLSKKVAELLVERMQRRATETAARERQAPDSGVGPGHEPPTTPAVVHALALHEAGSPREESVTLEHARALLHDGAAEQALRAAQAQQDTRNTHGTHDNEPRGEWLVLQGDALRALGKPRQAVQLYLAAQDALTGEGRARAAFKAADLSLRVLDDPSAALNVLDHALLDAPGAPLRERALLLRIEAQHRLGRPLRTLALRYLAAYPDSAGAAHMRELIATPGVE